MITRRFLFAGLALSVLLGAGTASAAQLEDGADKFIRSLAGQAIGSLTDQAASREVRVERFRELFNDRFAVHAIGKFVLGRHWRKATDTERDEYLGLFEDLMVVSYVDRFASYAGESLEVVKTRADNDKTATVFSRIDRPGGAKAVRVAWRVGSTDDTYKILDVVVEGASMSSTLRSDFGSIVRRKGGKVAGLLEELRTKTASLKEVIEN